MARFGEHPKLVELGVTPLTTVCWATNNGRMPYTELYHGQERKVRDGLNLLVDFSELAEIGIKVLKMRFPSIQNIKLSPNSSMI